MPPKASNRVFLSSYAVRLQSKAKNYVGRKSISEAEETAPEPPTPAPQDFRVDVAPPLNGKKKEAVDAFMEEYLKKKEAQAEALKIKHRKEVAERREREQKEAAAIEQRKKNKQLEDAAALETARQQLQERRARATSPLKPVVPTRESASHATPSKPVNPVGPSHGPSPRNVQQRAAAIAAGESASPLGAPKLLFDSPNKHPYAAGALASPEVKPPAAEKNGANPRSSHVKASALKKGTVAPSVFKFDSAAPQEAMLIDLAHDIHNVMDLNDVVVENKHENYWSPKQQTRSRFHHDEQTTVHKSIGETAATKINEIRAAEAQKFEDAKRRRLSAEAENKRRASSEGGTIGRRTSEPKAMTSRRASSEKDAPGRRQSSQTAASMVDTLQSDSEVQPPPPLEALVKDPFEVSAFQPRRKQEKTSQSQLENSQSQHHNSQQNNGSTIKQVRALETHSDESWMARIAPSSYSQAKLVQVHTRAPHALNKNDESAEAREDSMQSRSVVGFKALPVGQPLGPAHSRALQPGHVKQQINPNLRGMHSIPEGSFLVDTNARPNRDASSHRTDDSYMAQSDNCTTESMSQQDFNGTMASINPSTAHRVNSTVNLVKVLEDRQRAEAGARSNAKKNFHKNAAARAALAALS
jgi:hypothetical protein